MMAASRPDQKLIAATERMRFVRAFGKRIVRMREERGLTPEDLATRSGIGKSELSRIENGIQEPWISTLVRLAHGLGVRPEALLVRLKVPGARRAAPDDRKPPHKSVRSNC